MAAQPGLPALVNLLAGLGRLLSCATRSAYAQFTQNDLQGAEIGERRLNQIEPDESSEPKPIRTVIVCQHEADEDESPSKSPNDHFHIMLLSLVQTARYQRSDHHFIQVA